MRVNAIDSTKSNEFESSVDADAAWVARLNDVFAAWAAWATESNARCSARFRNMFADRWIELRLAELVLADARTAAAESRAAKMRQARAWTLRCIERMTSSVAETRGIEGWMNDGLSFRSASRASEYVEAV